MLSFYFTVPVTIVFTTRVKQKDMLTQYSAIKHHDIGHRSICYMHHITSDNIFAWELGFVTGFQLLTYSLSCAK
jgi:hypothetical protein